MSLSLELEIKALLDEPGDAQSHVNSLLASFENSEEELSLSRTTTLARFLLRGGFYKELIEFVLRKWQDKSFPIPWPYFLEAIALSRTEVSADLGAALLKGLDETKARTEASRSRALDGIIPGMKAERADRRLQTLKNYRRQKEVLLEELMTLRTQQLYEHERRVLEKLGKMFPGDPDVEKELRNHKDRYALEILARHSRFQKHLRTDSFERDPLVEKIKPAMAQLLTEAAVDHRALAADFAVAAATLDLWETALNILALAEDTTSTRWLRLELLLAAGRHVELLQDLSSVEMQEAGDHETFFATAYLRAQAMWGLGQKESAIEIMEALLASVPQYRSGVSLLTLWRAK